MGHIEQFLFACEQSRKLGFSAPYFSAEDADGMERELRGVLALVPRWTEEAEYENACGGCAQELDAKLKGL